MVRPVNRGDSVHSSAGDPFPVAKGIFSLQTPAKINWFLRIAGKRQDGYHDVVSLMQCVSLYDELTFGHDDSITVESNLGIPVADNLIYRAATLLKQYADYGKGARIILRKQIPLSAGLGGGSSDAACTLSGLNALWGLGLRNEELRMIGSRIGSDIPFFFHPPAALVEGKGDIVKPLRADWSFVLLLVKPDVRVSTAWAYGAFEQVYGHALTKKPIDIKLFCQALQRQDFLSLTHLLFNDLEEVVMREYPAVREIKQKLVEAGAETSLMSGSGPTVFGIFRSLEKAEKAVDVMRLHWCRIVQGLS
jgi:4-diphosphocytidyl-2-C-methyl-D-erythritol kinase